MNRKELEEFLKQFGEETEIIIIDSMGSEFPIDRVDKYKNRAAVILKRCYKNVDNNSLPLKLEKNKNGNK